MVLLTAGCRTSGTAVSLRGSSGGGVEEQGAGGVVRAGVDVDDAVIGQVEPEAGDAICDRRDEVRRELAGGVDAEEAGAFLASEYDVGPAFVG